MSARQRPRHGPAVVLALVLVLSTAVLGRAAPARAGADAATALRLVAQTPYVGPAGVFAMTLAVDAPPAGAQIVFRQYADVASSGRDRFTRTIAGEELGRLDKTVRVPLDQLPRDANGYPRATFPIRSDRVPPLGGLQLTTAGVYPITVTLETADGADVARLVSHIVKLPEADEEDAALTVATVVPLRSTPGLQPSGSTELPPTEQARLRDAIRALATHPGTAVTATATPETLQALDTLAAGQDADAVGGRDIPDTTELTSATYMSVDLGAWVSDGMAAGLARQLFVGTDTLRRTTGRDPDVGTWAVDPTTTPATLDWLADTGIERLVVPEARLEPLVGAGRFGSLVPFDVLTPSGRRLHALAGDDALAAHVADTDDPVLNAQHTVADLAMLYFQEPGIERSVGLLLPDDAPAGYLDTLLGALSPEAFRDAAAQSTDAPAPRQILRAATARDAVAQVAPATGGIDTVEDADTTLVRTLTPGQPGSLGTYPTQLAFANTSLAGYRSMLPEGELGRMAPLEQLVDVSAARTLDARGRQDYLDATVARVDAEAAQISVPAQARVTLTEETAEIQVVVDNAADHPMVVRLDLTSDKLDFPDGAQQVVTVEPGSNRIPVAVRSRTSGAFPIGLTVSSPDGSIAIASNRFTIRSTAVSGIGLVISIGAGVFLLLWWVRNFRSARRRRALVDGGATA